MEKFAQITKKSFCLKICGQPSVFAGAGKARENFLEEQRDKIIETCKNIITTESRMGILRSKFISFIDKHGNRSRLDFDQINTEYSFFSLSDILVCKMYHKELNEYRYIIYKII